MPLYGSQLVSNTPLQSVGMDQVVPATLLNAESLIAGQKSLACCLQSKSPAGEDFQMVSIRFSCPAGAGGAVEYHIQTADFDADGEYNDVVAASGGSEISGGTAIKVVTGSFSAAGVARVQLQVTRSRFLRVSCVTAASNPMTVTVL